VYAQVVRLIVIVWMLGGLGCFVFNGMLDPTPIFVRPTPSAQDDRTHAVDDIQGVSAPTLSAQAVTAAEQHDCVCAFAFVNAVAAKEPTRRTAIMNAPRFSACIAKSPEARRELWAATARDGAMKRCFAVYLDGRD
jgi:hypothetical protein